MKGIALIIHLVLGAMLGTSHVLSYLIFIANTWDRITTPVLQMRRLGLRLGNFSKMAESGLDSKAQSGSQGKPRAWFLGRRSPCPALAVKRRGLPGREVPVQEAQALNPGSDSYWGILTGPLTLLLAEWGKDNCFSQGCCEDEWEMSTWHGAGTQWVRVSFTVISTLVQPPSSGMSDLEVTLRPSSQEFLNCDYSWSCLVMFVLSLPPELLFTLCYLYYYRFFKISTLYLLWWQLSIP